jgi:16S rRNA (uracil1498-N3)-methyltransferase
VEQQDLGSKRSATERRYAHLDSTDRHHLIKVMRLSVGDRVELADGSGTLFQTTISAVGPQHVRLQIDSTCQAAPRPGPKRWLVYGLAKGARNELVLQKATELGVDRLMPAICERSIARPKDAEGKKERWLEIVRQAARQCERADLPVLDPPAPFCDLVSQLSARLGRDGLFERSRLLIALANASPLSAMVSDLLDSSLLALAVGPEGGFTDREIRHANDVGFIAAGLGPMVLRSETAALAGLAVLTQLSGGWG